MADTSLGQKQFKNYLEVVDTILKEEGPAGLWKGLTASYIGMCVCVYECMLVTFFYM